MMRMSRSLVSGGGHEMGENGRRRLREAKATLRRGRLCRPGPGVILIGRSGRAGLGGHRLGVGRGRLWAQAHFTGEFLILLH